MVKKAILLVFKGYQRISRLWPRTCRFYPTCSTYAVAAVSKYGVWKGLYLAGWRLLRCHPGNPGGYDPVP